MIPLDIEHPSNLNKILAETCESIYDTFKTLKKNKDVLKELVLGFPMNPAGDFTDQYVRKILSEKPNGYRLVSLGRGLSTGTELEYSDPETIKNALKNRA